MESNQFSRAIGIAPVISLSLAATAGAQTLIYSAVFNGTDGSATSTVIQSTGGNFYATTADCGSALWGNR